ncbi:MAG: FAD-binding domain-containing protein [Pseudomonadota bacterium]
MPDARNEDSLTWLGQRATGLERLDDFLPKAGKAYASMRNYDLGPQDHSNVSCLSPWVRHRLILETEVLAKTRSVHSFRESEKFIQEVFWRTYFKGWLEHRPDVWRQYQLQLRNLQDELDKSSGMRQDYGNAVAGKTGIECFDAWANELKQTGYLHNHARMWFASIWIFTLRLPWQLGADFFYRHLLDGDPASNTLSWRWVAGLHTKGKHYVARASNIEKYTQGRFSSPNLALDPEPLFEPFEYPICPIDQGDDMRSISDFGLLITEEDCMPEALPLAGNPSGICALCLPEDRSQLPIGDGVSAFVSQAVTDALGRAEKHFDRQAVVHQSKDWEHFLIDWARSINVSTIITAYAPMGPVQNRLETVAPVLEEAGITLLRVKRDYDVHSWPYATRGFFKMKEKIPTLLNKLDL